MPFLEIKHHYDKATQQFECEVVTKRDDWVLLSYISDRSWQIGAVILPVGSQTVAYYEAGAPCVVWRMLFPNNSLAGHLFHICRDLEVGDSRVEYQDLLLDIWVCPEQTTTLLDEDDLDGCVKNGQIGAHEANAIREIAHKIEKDWLVWIQKLDRALTWD